MPEPLQPTETVLQKHQLIYGQLSPYLRHSDEQIIFPEYSDDNPVHNDVIEYFSKGGIRPIKVSGLGSLQRDDNKDMLTARVQYPNETVYIRLTPVLELAESGEPAEINGLLKHNIEVAYYTLCNNIGVGAVEITHISGPIVNNQILMLTSTMNNGGVSLDGVIDDERMASVKSEVRLKLSIQPDELIELMGRNEADQLGEYERRTKDYLIRSNVAYDKDAVRIRGQMWLKSIRTHYEILNRFKGFVEREPEQVLTEMARYLISISCFGRDWDNNFRNMLIDSTGKSI